MWVSQKEWNALNGRLNFLTKMIRRFDPLGGFEEIGDSVRLFPDRLYDATHITIGERGIVKSVSVADIVVALVKASDVTLRWDYGTPARVVIEKKS